LRRVDRVRAVVGKDVEVARDVVDETVGVVFVQKSYVAGELQAAD
jgi:hypothetical protein